jgi:hypothetical protein
MIDVRQTGQARFALGAGFEPWAGGQIVSRRTIRRIGAQSRGALAEKLAAIRIKLTRNPTECKYTRFSTNGCVIHAAGPRTAVRVAALICTEQVFTLVWPPPKLGSLGLLPVPTKP